MKKFLNFLTKQQEEAGGTGVNLYAYFKLPTYEEALQNSIPVDSPPPNFEDVQREAGSIPTEETGGNEQTEQLLTEGKAISWSSRKIP